jgi:hypothetical protein
VAAPTVQSEESLRRRRNSPFDGKYTENRTVPTFERQQQPVPGESFGKLETRDLAEKQFRGKFTSIRSYFLAGNFS